MSFADMIRGNLDYNIDKDTHIALPTSSKNAFLMYRDPNDNALPNEPKTVILVPEDGAAYYGKGGGVRANPTDQLLAIINLAIETANANVFTDSGTPSTHIKLHYNQAIVDVPPKGDAQAILANIDASHNPATTLSSTKYSELKAARGKSDFGRR